MKPLQVDRERVRQAFSAADAYDQHAHVQRLAARRLADQVAALGLGDGSAICEIGCGTGFLSEELARRISGARLLVSDISPEMLARARRRLGEHDRFEFEVIDGERPEPLHRRGLFDVICSNFAVQWFSDLGRAIDGLLSCVKPGGHVLVTTLTAETFSEWRRAHGRIGLEAGTPEYPRLEELQAMAPAQATAQVEGVTYLDRYASGRAFVESLRAIGADTPSRTHRPVSFGQMRRVFREFEVDGAQVTYEVAFCRFRRNDS
ncbi:methyltransferase [Phenylobacterium sp. LjRoot225]|uniref:methyltransferase n=1 Tax=Phenylobacterium sp. LjRoot225 TaxID=3342285 RepID=UPI003F50AB5B